MKITRVFAFAAASAAAVMTLAACGQNEPKKEPAPIETPVPSAAESSGGALANPSDNIVANASKAANLTTLVSAIQAADLTTRLQGPGPFTVFAPDNAAFDKIPAATRENWMQPAHKADLVKVLTYHVVPGRLTTADIASQVWSNGGKATLTTVQGEKLTFADAGGGQWRITDAKGGTSTITQADAAQSNGVIHVIDTVLTPQ